MQQFYKRVVYIRDFSSYYDIEQKRPLSEDEARALLLTLGAPIPVVENILHFTKMQPQPASLYIKGRVLINDLIDDIYEELAPKLNLYRQATTTATLVYSVNDTKQVTFEGQLKDDKFLNLVVKNTELFTLIKSRYSAHSAIRNRHDMTNFLREIEKRFKLDHKRLWSNEPDLLSYGDRPAYKVIDPSQFNEGPHPTWDEFTTRLDFPETFMAYVWSVFVPTNFGRQALWLYGEGHDGKSSVVNALSNFMGRSHTFTFDNNSYNSDFFYGSAFGKRLAIYADCKNPSILRTEKIKSLLGRDIVSINEKYMQAFSAQVYAKLFVLSNLMPQINWNDNSERTRLLLVQVSKPEGKENGDSGFQIRLEEELPYFLHTCKAAYERECQSGMQLNVPERMSETIRLQCTSSDADLMEQFMEERLEFDPQYYVRKTDLKSELTNYFAKYWSSRDMNFQFLNLIKSLQREQGTEEKRVRKGDKQLRALVGVRLQGTKDVI